MAEQRRDRRRTQSDLTARPPSSPATFLILVVAGVLAVTALAAALFGDASEETTPHGQLLTSLGRAAAAQEMHYQHTGSFIDRLSALGVDPAGEARFGVVQGDGSGWKVSVSHPVGLLCVQEGSAREGRPARDAPVCYATAAD